MTSGDPARRNSFDAVRLFAAFSVFLSHEIGMLGYPEPALGPFGIALSSIALHIFFAVSGYLVFQSLERNPQPGRYLRARLLRIYPGAAVNAVFCVLLGAAITTLPQAAFWSEHATWAFVTRNVLIVVTPSHFDLPGVFEDARWHSVNGSIWTIKYEVLCYLVLLAIGLIGRRLGVSLRRILLWVAVVLVANDIAYLRFGPIISSEAFFGRYNLFNLSRFLLLFLAGSFYAASEPLSAPVRLACFAVPSMLVAIGPSPEVSRVGFILLLGLLTIEIGKSPLLFSRTYRRVGDISYGFYLYAYPVQNLITSRLSDGSNGLLVASLSLLATLGLATLSWWLVEKPALRLKLTRPRRADERNVPAVAGNRLERPPSGL